MAMSSGALGLLVLLLVPLPPHAVSATAATAAGARARGTMAGTGRVLVWRPQAVCGGHPGAARILRRPPRVERLPISETPARLRLLRFVRGRPDPALQQVECMWPPGATRRGGSALGQVLDADRLDGARGVEAEDARVEPELPVLGGDDALRLAEAVVLALEGDQGAGKALGVHRLEHRLGLLGRDDTVVETLEEGDGAGEAVGVVDGGALAVEVEALRVGTDQAVQIARLELVGVAGEELQVGNAEEAGAGGEAVAEGEHRQRRVPARATAVDGQARTVDAPLAHQVQRAVDAVLDVDDPPGAVEALPVLPPVAAAAAIVDVEDGET